MAKEGDGRGRSARGLSGRQPRGRARWTIPFLLGPRKRADGKREAGRGFSTFPPPPRSPPQGRAHRLTSLSALTSAPPSALAPRRSMPKPTRLPRIFVVRHGETVSRPPPAFSLDAHCIIDPPSSPSCPTRRNGHSRDSTSVTAPLGSSPVAAFPPR